MTGFDADRFDRLVSQRAVGDAAPPSAEGEALDALLVHSFLLFDASPHDAERAVKKLQACFVDLNELRVSRLDDIVAAIGPRYPRAEARAAALRRTLNDLFNRENAVSLAPVAEKNKRDAKLFLCSLDGCPAYVASRVLLIGFGGHALPLDALLHERLTDAKIFDESVDLERAASILERHVKASDALGTHLAIETLRDDDARGARPKGPKAAGKRA